MSTLYMKLFFVYMEMHECMEKILEKSLVGDNNNYMDSMHRPTDMYTCAHTVCSATDHSVRCL